MRRKRYTGRSEVFEFDRPPESTLRSVVEGVQSDDARRHRDALLALLASGPWQSNATLNRFYERAQRRDADATVAFECRRLTALLHEIVRARELGSATARVFTARVEMQAI